MTDAILMVPKIVRWGLRSPGKIKKWGNGRMNSGANNHITDAAMLCEQARSYGWMNGKRLERKKRG